MPRIFLGILCILLGLGSCLGVPIFGVFMSNGDIVKQLADPPLLVTGSDSTFKVETAGRYELMLVTQMSVNGEPIGVSVRDLPDGDFGYVAADGTEIKLTPSTVTDTLDLNGDGFNSIGGARLEPGTYTLLAPETEQPIYFWPIDTDQVIAMGEAALLWFGIGAGVMVVFLIIGILLIVSGAKANRKGRQEDYA